MAWLESEIYTAVKTERTPRPKQALERYMRVCSEKRFDCLHREMRGGGSRGKKFSGSVFVEPLEERFY
jgi:hypothetical protein